MAHIVICHPDEPAFPTAERPIAGLTKREHFAALALQGLLAAAVPDDLKLNLTTGVPSTARIYARMAVGLANALIDALNVKE